MKTWFYIAHGFNRGVPVPFVDNNRFNGLNQYPDSDGKMVKTIAQLLLYPIPTVKTVGYV